MRQISDKEKQKLLSLVSWDLDLMPEQLLQLFNNEVGEIGGFDRTSLYRRLLTTFDWYTLQKLATPDKLKQILDDSVLNRLFPKDLKEKFIYAKKILSE